MKKQYIFILAFIIFFSAKAQEDGMQTMKIEFNSVDGPEVKRELLLGFSEYTSDSFDLEYDTKNLDVLDNDLNLILNEDLMLQQAYSAITENKVVPLVFQSSGSYNFTIELTETDKMEGQEIHIMDVLLNIVFNLRDGEAYEFSSDEGYFPNRFVIVFKSQSDTLSQTNQEIENLNVYYAMNANKIIVLNPESQKVNSIELYNVFGQTVYSNQNIYQGNSIEVEPRNLTSGIYIIRLVTANNGMLTKKIIVK